MALIVRTMDELLHWKVARCRMTGWMMGGYVAAV